MCVSRMYVRAYLAIPCVSADDNVKHTKSNIRYDNKQNYEKNVPQARFFMKQNVPQARLMKQNAPQARFFDQVLKGILSYWYSM